jgi:hypothetical protein
MTKGVLALICMLALLATATVAYAINQNQPVDWRGGGFQFIDNNVQRLAKIIRQQVRNGRALDVSELDGCSRTNQAIRS